MISSSSTADKKKEVRSYPKIMKGKGYTVLFTKNCRGTVIHKDAATFGKVLAVGDYCTDWCMKDFKETDDTIRLCSKEKGVLL